MKESTTAGVSNRNGWTIPTHAHLHPPHTLTPTSLGWLLSKNLFHRTKRRASLKNEIGLEEFTDTIRENEKKLLLYL